MASGHVNRTNRPNTWLHRPACKREEKPCQLGAVHTWPTAKRAAPRTIEWCRGEVEKIQGVGGRRPRRRLRLTIFLLRAKSGNDSKSLGERCGSEKPALRTQHSET
jgi:hypothetical protein